MAAVVGLGTLSGVWQLRERSAARQIAAQPDSAASAKVATAPVSSDSVIPQGGQATPPSVAAQPATTPPATTTTAPAAPASVRDAGFSPTIKSGDTPLANGVIATRNDSGVFVAFDTPELRTRVPEKFEQILRTTLSQVYGPRIDSVLATIPPGKIVAQGDLLYDLPTRGIQLPVQTGWHLEVLPEIRPGRDGPLVVRYRAIVVKN